MGPIIERIEKKNLIRMKNEKKSKHIFKVRTEGRRWGRPRKKWELYGGVVITDKKIYN